MKKALTFGVIGLLTLVSCKREFVCKCTFSNSGSLEIKYTDEKKKTAENECSSAEETYKQGDSGVSCSLN